MVNNSLALQRVSVEGFELVVLVNNHTHLGSPLNTVPAGYLVLGVDEAPAVYILKVDSNCCTSLSTKITHSICEKRRTELILRFS